MTLKCSTGFGLGTLFPKLATHTCSSGCGIFIMFSFFKIFPLFQDLASRTYKDVFVCIVGEGLFGEDPFFGTGIFLGSLQRFK